MLCDPSTQQEYVLLPAEQYQKLLALSEDGVDMKRWAP